MLKNRSRTAVVASQSGKNNNTSSDRMQLGSYQIPRLVEQWHSISTTAVEDVEDVNRHPPPSNVPYFSLTFLNPANENSNPHAPENSTIVQNDRRDEDVTMMNTKMENLHTHEVVSSEFSNEIMNAIDCDRRFGRDITNQSSSPSARKRSRTTIDGTSLNLKSSEAEASPPKKLGRPPRERTNKENAITHVENQLPKTTNESFQTPTVTNVPKKRARGRTIEAEKLRNF
uniref:Uncharacterized protein n=1 Tax=Panagrolaimus superbus TaxID=310955 RepID=A0A914XTZ4_9BILA